MSPEETLNAAMANLPGFVEIDKASALEEMRMTPETAVAAEQPRLYQVETTSRCNLRCGFCPRTIDLLESGKRDLDAVMPLPQFEAVLDQMPWLRSIELFHFGEPFMHKDLDRYIGACTSRGIYSVVASNLLPATDDKLDRAFAAGLKFLVMDVDSLDPQRYAAARVGGRLDLLQQRVKSILSRPREQRPFCVAQTIMLDGTPEFTEEEFVEWTGGLPAEEVRYKFLDSFRGSVVNKGVLGPDDLCREAFYGMTIHVNGDVVPCDRDWSGENVMGNVFTQDVMAIWKGEKFEAFRAAMRSKEKPAMCRSCPEGKMVNLRSQPFVQVNMFRGEEVYHA